MIAHTPAWRALAAHYEATRPRLRDLFAADPERAARFSYRFGPLLLDLSKQRWDSTGLALALEAAEQCHWRRYVRDLLHGAIVNPSEARPALHTLLRTPRASVPAGLEPAAVAIAETRGRMQSLAEALRCGQAEALGLAAIRDVVHIGIGGSDLGPRLVVEALGAPSGAVRVHFLSNVDGHALARLLPQLAARHTLLVVVSKSFSTAETLLNAESLRRWLVEQGVDDPGRHLLAITARPDRARDFGVRADLCLPMWDWVGGRYSVWSAVGLPIAIAHGMATFEALLAGAHALDRHFEQAEAGRHLPLLMALTSLLNRAVYGAGSRAVVPYDERLVRLPEYLQQLEMESNGKSVGAQGETLPGPTVPVVWGGVGSNVQHAFFQALHQGSEVIPVEFLAAVQPDHGHAAHHRVLLANLLGQAAALLQGEDATVGIDPARDPERWARARQQSFAGDRPSTTLLLERLDAYGLGALLALYEHKTYLEGCFWGINPFDQWGVELGKRCAAELIPALDGAPLDGRWDSSTRALVAHLRTCWSRG